MKNYSGLNDNEVIASREKYGSNKLKDIKTETFFQKYFKSFDDPIITILLVALGINVIFTFFGKVDWFECAGILVSVLIATLISTLSEFKNEKNFKLLSEEASQIESKVFRNNSLQSVKIDDVVLGDYILLQTGDLIPADGIIIDGNIKVDQSALNGENKEVDKYPDNEKEDCEDIIDFWNNLKLYRGSVVTSGQCVMKCTKIGDNTVYGRLNSDTEQIERDSPLTVKLRELAKGISKFGYIGAFLTVVIILFQKCVIDNHFDTILISNYFFNYTQVLADFVEALIMGIVVIVVAVPEGLPLMIAIVSSLNMKKMLKNNVLVRKLSGIETSGSMNILFCDKTGTITKGNLKATEIICGDLKIIKDITDIGAAFKKMLYLSITANSTVHVSGNKLIGGNSTEKALYSLLTDDKKPIYPNVKKITESVFSSKTKYSSATVTGDFNGTLYKGAPEKILTKCTDFIDNDGCIKPIKSIFKLNSLINEYAEEQKRILALAYTNKRANVDSIPEELTLLGLVVIQDELRFNVRTSVESVQRAGIQVVMITGDKKETAIAIAKESGIINSPDDIVMTTKELSELEDRELKNILSKVKVIARALPTDKSRLVRIAQEMGLVVGMTGDGVNDSPALRKADVGFAMGSGTEAAKEAGDIIIMDDNFSSIKNAVLFGRTIYKSIKKFICYQLTINVAAVSVSILGPMVGVYKPLNISQMLWINLVMDTLAAIAFGGEAALNKYLLEKPKKRNERIMDKRLWSSILTGGLFISIISVFIFCSDTLHSFFRESPEDIYFYTGYFTFFIFSCIFNAFNTRCEGIDLADHLSCNKLFLIVMFIILIFQILMTYFGGALLRTAGLSLKELFIVLSLSILIVPIDLIRKIVLK